MPTTMKKVVKIKKNKDFTTSFVVDQTPAEAFAAVVNVRAWWAEYIKGGTAKKGDEFTFSYPEMHYSQHKLTQVIPNKKVVWLCTESKLTFIKDQTEWEGTECVFEITPKGKKTEVKFTHKDLVPGMECYKACSGGWTYYIQDSLKKLIETGKGQPEKK